MAQVPRNQEVTRAIRSLARQTQLATKEANQLAASLARGDYAGAQSLITLAQAISAFGNEVLGLNGRWREVRSAGKGPKKGKDSQTPLWEFYRPILQALASLGGEATRKDIEAKLEETLTSSLKKVISSQTTRRASMEDYGWASEEAHDRRGFRHRGEPAQMEDNEQGRVLHSRIE